MPASVRYRLIDKTKSVRLLCRAFDTELGVPNITTQILVCVARHFIAIQTQVNYTRYAPMRNVFCQKAMQAHSNYCMGDERLVKLNDHHSGNARDLIVPSSASFVSAYST